MNGTMVLRNAFNDAVTGISCTAVLLNYERHEGVEWQRLTFRGTKPNGAPFEVKSDLLPAETNLEAITRSVAKQMADKSEPTT